MKLFKLIEAFITVVVMAAMTVIFFVVYFGILFFSVVIEPFKNKRNDKLSRKANYANSYQ